MSVTATIILGLAATATSLITNEMNKADLREAEKKAEKIDLRNFTEDQRTSKISERIAKRQIDLSEKTSEANIDLSKKQLALQKLQSDRAYSETARQNLRNHATKLSSILANNENLKSLYINRLKSLRRAA